MNHIIVMGRLTRDPQVREGEMTIAKYTLAVDRRKKDEADFIPVTVFGKGADFAAKYLHKGTKVVVSGRVQTGSYTNKDGKKVSSWEVVAEDQEFAESKSDTVREEKKPEDNFMDIPEGAEFEGLPFV